MLNAFPFEKCDQNVVLNHAHQIFIVADVPASNENLREVLLLALLALVGLTWWCDRSPRMLLEIICQFSSIGNFIKFDHGIVNAILGKYLLYLIAIIAVRIREKHYFWFINHLLHTNWSIIVDQIFIFEDQIFSLILVAFIFWIDWIACYRWKIDIIAISFSICIVPTQVIISIRGYNLARLQTLNIFVDDFLLSEGEIAIFLALINEFLKISTPWSIENRLARNAIIESNFLAFMCFNFFNNISWLIKCISLVLNELSIRTTFATDLVRSFIINAIPQFLLRTS